MWAIASFAAPFAVTLMSLFLRFLLARTFLVIAGIVLVLMNLDEIKNFVKGLLK